MHLYFYIVNIVLEQMLAFRSHLIDTAITTVVLFINTKNSFLASGYPGYEMTVCMCVFVCVGVWPTLLMFTTFSVAHYLNLCKVF